LLEVKGNEARFKTNNTWNDDAKARIAAAAWRQAGEGGSAADPVGDLRSLLIHLAAAVNAQCRDASGGGALSMFLKAFLSSSMAWAESRDTVKAIKRALHKEQAEQTPQTNTSQLAQNSAGT
jgi:hypothetical protein